MASLPEPYLILIRDFVVIDNAGGNWNAWGNSVWLALYVIDRHGDVRYRWLGELRADEDRGEKFQQKRQGIH